MDKLVKITMVYSKIWTTREKFRKRIAAWHTLKKPEMDGCAAWMKRDDLYASGVVGSETMYMGYVEQELYSM